MVAATGKASPPFQLGNRWRLGANRPGPPMEAKLLKIAATFFCFPRWVWSATADSTRHTAHMSRSPQACRRAMGCYVDRLSYLQITDTCSIAPLSTSCSSPNTPPGCISPSFRGASKVILRVAWKLTVFDSVISLLFSSPYAHSSGIFSSIWQLTPCCRCLQILWDLACSAEMICWHCRRCLRIVEPHIDQIGR